MTLAEFRGIKKPKRDEQTDAAHVGETHTPVQHGHEVVVSRERPHPGPWEYIQIGLALGFVTAIEVGVYYLDVPQGVLIAILGVLSTIKFSMVAMWFMHLKFDSQLFSVFFVGGLALAMTLFVVVLATLGAGLI